MKQYMWHKSIVNSHEWVNREVGGGGAQSF